MAEYNVRQERSNAGASALAQGFLTNVFGLTNELATRLLDTIETSGEMPALRQSIKLLPVSHHTQLNNMIDEGDVNGIEDTPFTDEDLGDETMDPAGDEAMDAPTDDLDLGSGMDDSISPDEGDSFDADSELDDMGADQGDLRNNSDADDFSADARKDSFKEGLSSFKSFRENAVLNAKLDAEISSNMDGDIDEQTLKKIKNLEAKGQKQSADQLRKQALRRNKAGGNQGTTPTERAVLAKKKELARAIQADKIAKAKAGAV